VLLSGTMFCAFVTASSINDHGNIELAWPWVTYYATSGQPCLRSPGFSVRTPTMAIQLPDARFPPRPSD
jgi:hypothetical protein